MWVVPTDLVCQRALFYAVDKADYQLILLLTKQLNNGCDAPKLLVTCILSSYSLVEAILAEPLSLLVRKALARLPTWSFSVLCCALAASYYTLIFAQSPITMLIARIPQAACLLMDSLALTQMTQGVQSPEYKRAASNQTEIILNSTALLVQLCLLVFQQANVKISYQFFTCVGMCTAQAVIGLICAKRQEAHLEAIRASYCTAQPSDRACAELVLRLLICLVCVIFPAIGLLIIGVGLVFWRGHTNCGNCEHGGTIKSLLAVQGLQSLIHQVNQVHVTHGYPESTVLTMNVLRQILVLCSALCQASIQHAVRANIMAYFQILIAALIICQLVKLTLQKTQCIVMLIYVIETPINALLNHFVQAIVLSCEEDVSGILGMSAQIKSLATGAGGSVRRWGAILVGYVIEYAVLGICTEKDNTLF